jgi:hypothetical protein
MWTVYDEWDMRYGEKETLESEKSGWGRTGLEWGSEGEITWLKTDTFCS